LAGPDAITNAHHVEKVTNKPISAFGFTTWTTVLDYTGGFDVAAYMLQVCEGLLYCGQVTQMHHLALTIEKEFSLREDERLLVRVTTLLARAAYLGGRFEDAVSLILARRPDMNLAGDANQLAQHTELLVQSYLKLDNDEEARAISLLALQLLEDVSLKLIDRTKVAAAATATGGGGSANLFSSSATAVGTTAAGGGRGGRGGGGASRTNISASASASVVSFNRKTSRVEEASALQLESSADNVTALLRVLRGYVAVTLYSTSQIMEESRDPRPLYTEMCEKLSRFAELMADVTGEVSALVAETLTLRATAALEFLVQFHQRVSGVVTPPEGYAAWMADNVLMCVEYMGRVVDMRQQLAKSVPIDELTYTSDQITADCKHTSSGQVSQVPYRDISNPVVRSLCLAQMQLSFLYVMQAVVARNHISRSEDDATLSTIVPPSSSSASAISSIGVGLSVIDKFLEETKPVRKYNTEDFKIPNLTRAGQLLGECKQRLTSSSGATSGTQINGVAEVELLRSTALLLQQLSEGQYNCMWRMPPPPTTRRISVTNANDHSLEGDAAATTATLKSPTAAGTPHGRKASTATAAAAAAAAAAVELAAAAPPNTTLGDVALSAEAKAARGSMAEQTRALVESCSAMCAMTGGTHTGGANAMVHSSKVLAFACLSLVEAFGAYRPASSAAWLLQLQSLQASLWLRSVWKDLALNPTSAVAASCARLEDLVSGRDWPYRSTVQQIVAEQEFLNNSCVAFKR
jgi:hypothetical protein